MASFNSVRFTSGRPLLGEITADKLNAILQEIRRNRPLGERGITVRQTGDGARIGLAAALKGGGPPPRRQPWDIYIEDSEGEGDEKSYTLKVQPGTLAGILPDDWNDEFEVSGSELFYGIAKVTTDGTFINSVEITITNLQPEIQEPVEYGLSESVDILFGLFKQGASYNLTGGTNIDVYGKNVIITTNEETEIGDPVFTLWFKLQ
jgi:hypothetical protein